MIASILTALLFLAAASRPPRAAAENEGRYIVKQKDGSAPFAVVSAAEMRRLNAAGALEWYEPDGTMTLLDDANMTYYTSDKWDLALIGAEAAFAQGYLGRGVRIGILDSGVNPHALLTDCLLPGHNYMEGADGDDTADHYGHGTQIAALIAGIGADGYVGVAPEAKLVPLKITDGKAVTVSTVVAAIYGAIDDYGCDVLNLSIGINRDFESLREAVEYAEAKGVTVVAAVGNNGTVGLNYPAVYETVIGVGSVDRDGSHYYRSNHNESVFLTAPGVNVKTAGHLGGYITATGTSFAVPYVAAAAAVALSIDGTLTPAQIRETLARTAEDRGTLGRDDDYGYGLLSIAGCVAALTESPEAPAPGCRLEPELGPAERLVNDTEETLECVYYLAHYDAQGHCLGVQAHPLKLDPGESAALTPPDVSRVWAQFFCNARTLAPLTEARRAITE